MVVAEDMVFPHIRTYHRIVFMHNLSVLYDVSLHDLRFIELPRLDVPLIVLHANLDASGEISSFRNGLQKVVLYQTQIVQL